jgi:hypothetical protein
MHCAVFCFRDTHGQFSYLFVYCFLDFCPMVWKTRTRLHTLLPLLCVFFWYAYAEYARQNSSVTRHGLRQSSLAHRTEPPSKPPTPPWQSSSSMAPRDIAQDPLSLDSEEPSMQHRPNRSYPFPPLKLLIPEGRDGGEESVGY